MEFPKNQVFKIKTKKCLLKLTFSYLVLKLLTLDNDYSIESECHSVVSDSL